MPDPVDEREALLFRAMLANTPVVLWSMDPDGICRYSNDKGLERLKLSKQEWVGRSVLAFYFAEQLKGIETSGFDISNFFADMMATFDPARESKRLAENADARKRATETIKLRQAQAAANAGEADSSGRAAFIKSMSAVDDLLRVKNYAEAELRLRALMQEYQGEPRIFFALGQAASLSAEDATDEDVQRERLTHALSHYRNAINISSPDTDRALVQRAYAAMGRIYEFFENTEEALKAFDAAIKLGAADRNAYDEALKGKARLGQPK